MYFNPYLKDGIHRDGWTASGWISLKHSKVCLHFVKFVLLSGKGPSNSRGKLFSVSVIAHGSPDQGCNSWSWCLFMAHRPGNVQYNETHKADANLASLFFSHLFISPGSLARPSPSDLYWPCLFHVRKNPVLQLNATHRSWWRLCVFLGHIVGKRNFLLTVPG